MYRKLTNEARDVEQAGRCRVLINWSKWVGLKVLDNIHGRVGCSLILLRFAGNGVFQLCLVRVVRLGVTEGETPAAFY